MQKRADMKGEDTLVLGFQHGYDGRTGRYNTTDSWLQSLYIWDLSQIFTPSICAGMTGHGKMVFGYLTVDSACLDSRIQHRLLTQSSTI